LNTQRRSCRYFTSKCLVVYTSRFFYFFCCCRYLQAEAIEQAKMSLTQISEMSHWPMEISQEWPCQTNGSDCGLFAAIGCECLCLGLPMIMNADRANFFREKMAVDIINGRLT